VHFAQNQSNAQWWRKMIQRAFKREFLDGAGFGSTWAGSTPSLKVVVAIIEIEHRFEAALSGAAFVERDLIQPRKQRRFAAKIVDLRKRAHENFLRDIFGGVAVMEQLKRQIQNALAIAVQQNIERRAFTDAAAREQNLFFIARRGVLKNVRKEDGAAGHGKSDALNTVKSSLRFSMMRKNFGAAASRLRDEMIDTNIISRRNHVTVKRKNHRDFSDERI
jgi:hypothetical protein